MISFLKKKNSSFYTALLSVFVLLFTCFVIIWGAYVRASRSGEGCGTDWPLCHGKMFPSLKHQETQIEWIHRLSSAMNLIFLIILSFLCIKKNKQIKIIVFLSLFFLFVEAFLGAILVIFSLVGIHFSFQRALFMILHFLNTLCLVGTLSLLILFLLYPQLTKQQKNIFLFLKKKDALLSCFIFLQIGGLGALAALIDTLMPTESLLEGLKMDWDKTSPLAIRLRIFHPFLALLFSARMIPSILSKIQSLSRSCLTVFIGKAFIFFILMNLCTGILNVLCLTPVTMQMIHLSVSLLTWICLVVWYRLLLEKDPPSLF